MRIAVSRTGGFAGIPRKAELDTAGLPDAERLDELSRRALAGGRAEAPRGVPDGFHYEITVDGDTVHCADPDLDDAQRELITRVLDEGA